MIPSIRNILRYLCTISVGISCISATSYKTELPLFGHIELSPAEDGTYHGTSSPVQLGALSCKAGHVTRYADTTHITARAYIRDTPYRISLERTRPASDLVEGETAFHGTIHAVDGDTAHLLGAPLYNATIDINTQTNIVEISADTRWHGLPLELTCTTLIQSDASLTITAQLANISRTWHPFADTELPARIRDIHVHDIEVGAKAGLTGIGSSQSSLLSGTQPHTDNHTDTLDFDSVADTCEHLFGALLIKGTAEILEIPVALTAELGLSGGEPGVAIVAALPDGWRVTDSFPSLSQHASGKRISQIEFHNTRCVVTSYGSYTIDDHLYHRGITIEGHVSWNPETGDPFLRALTYIFSSYHDGAPKLCARAEWDGTDVTGLYARTGVSSGQFGFALGPLDVYDGAMYLELFGEPAIGIAGSCFMRLSPHAEPLAWYLGVRATPEDIALSGSMQGTWHAPFGIEGLHVRNLALQGAQSYTAIAEAAASSGAAALIPSQAGLSGEGDISLPDESSITFDVKANVGKKITSLALLGYLRSTITFEQLARCLLAKAHLPHEGLYLPHIHLEEACLQIVPLGTYIGNVRVEQGVGASCYVSLGSHRAYIDIGTSVAEGGLHVYGQLPHIDIGPVHITGTEGKQEPTIDSVLSISQQHLQASGSIRIGDIFSTQHTIDINHHGLRFNFEHTVGPLRLAVSGATLEHRMPDDFILTVRCTHDSLDYLKEAVYEAVRNDADIAPRGQANLHRSLQRLHGLSLEDVYFHGSAAELVHAHAPHIYITVRKGDTLHTLHLTFNFRHPHRSVTHIAREIAKLFA